MVVAVKLFSEVRVRIPGVWRRHRLFSTRQNLGKGIAEAGLWVLCGLLEQTAGNQFRLRVYPIPAHGTRQVRLTIDEALRREGDAWRIDVPVQLLDQADGASMAIHVRGPRTAPVQVGNFDDLKFERARGGWTAKYDVLREHVECVDCLSRMRRLGLRLPVAAEAGLNHPFPGKMPALPKR